MNFKQTKNLVTGCAGFIGSKITFLLLERGDTVVGVDNLNDAYPPPLKEWRLTQIQKFPAFEFEQRDITHFDALKELFSRFISGHIFDAVMNLAAHAGVRASVENPWVYFETNIIGTLNLLELCSLRSPTPSAYGSLRSPTTSSYGKDFGVKKFLLASPRTSECASSRLSAANISSIYGENEMPFREDQKIVLQYLGTPFQEEDIADACNTTEVGTTLADAVHAVHSFGFNATIIQNATLEDLMHYLNRNEPVIVLVGVEHLPSFLGY